MTLEKITFAKFNFKVTFEKELDLPEYLGSAIRGAFGHALKNTVCSMPDTECENCPYISNCIYPYIFETFIPNESEIMTKNEKAPHPYIIEPEYFSGKNMSFNIILIGKVALRTLPYIVYTVINMGKNYGIGKDRNKFELEEVSLVKPNGKKNKLYNKDQSGISLNSEFYSINDLKTLYSEELKIEFVTHARFKQEGKEVNNLDFYMFMKNLYRRITTISYFHCNEKIELDFKSLLEKAKEIKTIESSLYWKDWERYSNRAKTKMKMGGIMGEIIFQGDMKEFFPYILLGEQLHIGKGATFGLGRYRIIPQSF